jgi:hypothetical protein
MGSELDQILARQAALEEERATIHRTIAPMQQRLVEIASALRPLHERRDKLRLAAGPLDWRVALKDLASNDRNSQTLLRHVERELAERFDMWHSGYWGDTAEADIELKVTRTDESEQKNLAGLRFFAPLLTSHANGRVWFGVFEHSLSAGGSFRLEVTPDLRELVLFLGRWERARFTTAEEAVRYIRAHHWYA